MKRTICEDFQNLRCNDDWTFSNTKDDRYSHNYHRYPAKFISPLVEKLIKEESSEGDTICDIFGGCGTTLVQAKILGRKSVGYDINPVAKLITEVKTKAINPQKLNPAYEQLQQRIECDLNNKVVHGDYDNTHERTRYWFSQNSYLTLRLIYENILAEQNEDIQKFFICSLSHCLKNSSRWLMTSIKPTIDKNKADIDIVKFFTRHTTFMLTKNDIFYQHLKEYRRLGLASKIRLKNITKLQANEEVDLIITSPPYVTSYEYADLHQLTLLWLGSHGYKNWGNYLLDFKNFKKEFIGSEVRTSELHDHSPNSSIGENIVCQLLEKNTTLACKVSTYYDKMNTVFKNMHTLLRKNKKACLVIGNTKLMGVDILNAEVALEQLLNIGFNRDVEIKRNANNNRMITPYRDKYTGKFTSKSSPNRTIAYHTEYILKVTK